jgi:hypothetical protein
MEEWRDESGESLCEGKSMGSCLRLYADGQSTLVDLTAETVGSVIKFFKRDTFWTLDMVAECVCSVAGAHAKADDAICSFVLNFGVPPEQVEFASSLRGLRRLFNLARGQLIHSRWGR